MLQLIRTFYLRQAVLIQFLNSAQALVLAHRLAEKQDQQIASLGCNQWHTYVVLVLIAMPGLARLKAY